jgi:acetyltransferase-like isoleucine patch superfamily enzyme
MAILSREEINNMGFASVGENVRISDCASFYGVNRITLGNDVRIDDFCVLSAGTGGIELGSYIHLAVASSLIGAGKITLSDFCGTGSRVGIYSSSDDFTGTSMTNPTVPSAFTGVTNADVMLGRHVIVGTGSVILPGVVLEEGVAVGALSLVNKNCSAFGIYSGNPARRISERKRDLLDLEQQFLKSKNKK